MTRKTLNLSDQVYDYLLSVSLREPEILQQLREETASHPWARMQISPDQGQFLALLVKILNAKKIIEVGVFTGYSSLCMALALADDGKIIACDINEEDTTVAQRYWQQAGVEHKVDLRIAPALETMDALIEKGEHDSYDFVFIDGEKSEYRDYYERSLLLLRTGGLITIDNVLWSGKPADALNTDKDTIAIRDFNSFLHKDMRIEISMLPVADGLTLARKC